jgi:hypothetical protein
MLTILFCSLYEGLSTRVRVLPCGDVALRPGYTPAQRWGQLPRYRIQ